MQLFAPHIFRDMTVVLTGAGRGIGLALCEAYLAHGARVIAHPGRSGFDEDNAVIREAVKSGRLIARPADFTRRGEVADFAAFVREKTDRIDVLVNNAGTMFGRFPAPALDEADYDRIVELNQASVVFLTRDMIPLLKANGGGSIVNTVSISARTGGSPGSAIYSAAKAFVATYTRALARELAPDGIRVNAISPGTIETAFHQRYSSAEKLEATRKSIPLARLGTGEDCAPACLFFSAPELSGYVTGQVLEINGGQLMA